MKKVFNGLEYYFSSLRLYFTGVAMGAADLIPGVSGGTIAFILGIYQHLLEAIKSFNVKFLSTLLKGKFKEALSLIPIHFLFFLGLGIGSAIFGMASLMSYLLENEVVYLFSFFFGLVLSSIITISFKVKWSISAIISLLIGTVGAYIIVGLIPLSMPHDPVTLFLSGAVAIMAMILPGISGSFILLILGQYDYVLNAVTEFNIFVLTPVALGIAVGIISFARILSWMLKKYHAVAVASLIGFMIGSLRKIWPWKETLETMIDGHGNVVPKVQANILPVFSSNEFIFASILALIGFALLIVVSTLQDRCDRKMEEEK